MLYSAFRYLYELCIFLWCRLLWQVRCSKYLYTLCVADSEKADKLRQSLPPGLQVKDIWIYLGLRTSVARLGVLWQRSIWRYFTSIHLVTGLSSFSCIAVSRCEILLIFHSHVGECGDTRVLRGEMETCWSSGTPLLSSQKELYDPFLLFLH